MFLSKASEKWLAYILLGFTGFLGNWLKVELFFNVDFLFGSFFVMLAVLMIGQWHSIVSGIIAATCTYFLWNHPWAIIIMGGEAAFVCLMYSRRKGNPVFYDMLYWMCIGMPLVYLFYHHVMAIQVQSTFLIMLKQAVNGVFNALMATLAYTLLSLRRKVPGRSIPYSQLIFVLMTSLVLLPAMIFLIAGMRAHVANEMEELSAGVSHVAGRAHSLVAGWIKEHHQSIQTLSTLIGDPAPSSFTEMQRYVETIKAASPVFFRMGVLNKDSVTVAYSPLKDENGKSTLGVDFSDRPYISIMRETKRPYVPDVVMGKFGNRTPIVLLLAPMVVEGEYRGYCAGVVETSHITTLLADAAEKNGITITLIDGKGKVIAGTSPDLKAMEPFERPYGNQVQPSEIWHWIPDPQPGTSIMQRWRSSLLIKTERISSDYGWKLVVEAPVLAVVEDISRYSIIGLSLLALLILFTVTMAHHFSRTVISTIVLLREKTRIFPERIREAREIEWPRSSILELEELSINFRDMALALSDSFQQQHVLNESLEERIKERTHELEEREIFIRDVLDSLTAHVAVLDHQGHIVAVNEAWRRFGRDNGYESETLGLGASYLATCKKPIEQGGNDEVFSAQQGIRAVIDGSIKHFSMEYPCHSQTEQRWFLMHVSRLSSFHRGVVIAHENITERVLAEQLVRENEEKYRRLFENELTAICIFDMDTYRFIDVNDAFVKLYGYSRDELVGEMTIHDVTVEHAASEEATQKARSDGTVFIPLRYHRKRDGTIIPVEIVGGPYSLRGKQVMFGMIRDITERKMMEDALKASEERFRLLVEGAPDAIFVQTQGLFAYVNPAASRLFGAEAGSELLGGPVLDRIHPDFVEQTRKRIQQLNLERRPVSASDVKVITVDSRIIDAETVGVPISYEGQDGALVFVRDITERKQTEEELKLFKAIVETSGQAIAISDPRGRLLYINPAHEKLFGLSLEEARRMNYRDYYPEESVRILDQVVSPSLMAGRGWEGELDVFDSTGRRFPLWERADTLFEPSGEVLYYFGLMYDMSERKKAEEERLQLEQHLQQAQKAESLGRMAGAIAHNFNNMLGAVIGNLEIALDEVPEGSELQVCISEAMNASRRAAEISRFMLTYVGQSTGKAEPIDMAKALREACALLSASMPDNVCLKADLPSFKPIVRGDDAQLARIMSNLITNAVEAIGEEQGEIVVTLDALSEAKVQEWKVFHPGWFPTGCKPEASDYACVTISDTGCGIAPENLDKIFDPFFSTKFTGRGLGLSVVLGLLRGFDGAISVESPVGKGTIFRVLFPASKEEGPAHPENEAHLSTTVVPGSGLVLVVDDEAVVRNMAGSMLKRKFNYEVISACDGYEALEIFKARKDEITLVLLDLSMPGMNGWQTLAALRSIRPDIPVILTSGYDEAQVSMGEHQERPQAFLSKPYRAKDLNAAILAARRSGAGEDQGVS